MLGRDESIEFNTIEIFVNLLFFLWEIFYYLGRFFREFKGSFELCPFCINLILGFFPFLYQSVLRLQIPLFYITIPFVISRVGFIPKFFSILRHICFGCLWILIEVIVASFIVIIVIFEVLHFIFTRVGFIPHFFSIRRLICFGGLCFPIELIFHCLLFIFEVIFDWLLVIIEFKFRYFSNLHQFVVIIFTIDSYAIRIKHRLSFIPRVIRHLSFL